MINFEEKYFKKFDYSKKDIEKYLSSAYKDLNIAEKTKISDVTFQFAYNALIKLGITFIACHGYKTSSRVGHHIKIINKISQILKNKKIEIYGNNMRKIRNTEMYDGGYIEITNKQARAYLKFVEQVFYKSDSIFKKLLGKMF